MGIFIWGAVAGMWTIVLAVGASVFWLRSLGKPSHESATEGEKTQLITYPVNYTFAVFDRPEDSDAAVEAIRNSNARIDDVIRLTGEAGAARLDASGEDHGLLGRLVRMTEAAVMDLEHVSRYEDEARAGHCVVGIRARDSASRHTVEAILQERGAYFINHYGRFQFESVPSAVSHS